jgi:hypothetical protein
MGSSPASGSVSTRSDPADASSEVDRAAVSTGVKAESCPPFLTDAIPPPLMPKKSIAAATTVKNTLRYKLGRTPDRLDNCIIEISLPSLDTGDRTLELTVRLSLFQKRAQL